MSCIQFSSKKNFKIGIASNLLSFFSRSKNYMSVLSQTSLTKNQANIACTTSKNETIQRIVNIPDSNIFFLPSSLNFSLPSNINVLVTIKFYTLINYLETMNY